MSGEIIMAYIVDRQQDYSIVAGMKRIEKWIAWIVLNTTKLECPECKGIGYNMTINSNHDADCSLRIMLWGMELTDG